MGASRKHNRAGNVTMAGRECSHMDREPIRFETVSPSVSRYGEGVVTIKPRDGEAIALTKQEAKDLYRYLGTTLGCFESEDEEMYLRHNNDVRNS